VTTVSPRLRRRKHFLMCRPTFFDVTYSINPWMDPGKPVDRDLAVAQWERIHDLYLRLGHSVELIDPVPGLPDMVFAANGATVVDGRVLLARFRHAERAAEAASYERWFTGRGGYREVHRPEVVNEGEGDYLQVGRIVLAGTGFRTDPRSHAEAQAVFGRPVVRLDLVDPRFYHLDTALAVLDETVAYYPGAFSPRSRAVLRELFPDALLADDADAEAFGLNAVCDGRSVVLPQAATHLAGLLRQRGYQPVGVDVSELMKAGGAVKCCTLEIGTLGTGAV
jgi:N-dimethylarginine dimethylaminohydrolase